MNKLESAGFTNLINEIKPNEETISEYLDKCIEEAEETISEYLDKCIEEAEETNINTIWFMEFKSQIEQELKNLKRKMVYGI